MQGLQPYPHYKDVGLPWPGKAPAHWVARRTKYIVQEVNARSTTGDEQLLRVSQFTGVTQRLRIDGQDAQDTRAASLVGYKRVQPDELVINIMLAWNGSMGVSHFAGIASPAYCVYRFKPDAHPWYFHHLFRSPAYKARIKAMSTGVVESRLRLYSDDLFRIEALLPPPDEQAAIVKFLDWANARLERTIRAKRRVIALLTEQKQAIIHRAVTRGLDPSVPLKPSGIAWLGDIPAHWEVRPLKAVCKIQSGTTLGKDYGAQQTYEFPYLRVANVQAGYVKLSVVKKVAVSMSEAQRRTLENGDVLMTEGGDLDKLGRGCVWEAQISPCLHQNHVFAVRPDKSKLDPQFLSALMGTPYARAYFQMTAKQTTNLAATNKTKIGQLSVLLPSVVQQREILVALGRETKPVDTAISRLNREIDLLCEYRTRLVADIVTGKLDVREAAAHLPQDDVQAALEPDALDPDEATDADADAELEE
ncbi:Type I restriction modification DNA specificity domain [Rhodoferax antarcticus ANT.BR]|uniref:Type I restriction modification DNA specificity domain n=1 Tax=Rhodoferax antarcticus ANT.BR TaxID=1111071 RepID=A0A1Q8YFM0_9BURK|nr:Type I restriction modification DNA specificity domain [Rhodoferax antarcticus ANT.BR]